MIAKLYPNFTLRRFVAPLAAVCCLGLAPASLAADLTVNVKQIEKIQGHLMVAVYHGESAYDSGEPAQASRVKVEGEEHAIVFSDLPDGEYAVKLYHDDNDNNKLDSNMFGIPKEGYGFSNNGGRFGPPAYSEARFDVKEKTEISIDLM